MSGSDDSGREPVPAPRLALGEQPPVFAHEATTGRFDLTSHLGRRPLVLLFLSDMTDPNCAGYAKTFVANADHYRGLGALVVIVTVGSAGGRALPGAVVVPNADDVFSRYRLMKDGEPQAAVVIVDRYGSVYAEYVAESCLALPAEPRVARLLLGAESVCPECGVPEEHWLEAAQ